MPIKLIEQNTELQTDKAPGTLTPEDDIIIFATAKQKGKVSDILSLITTYEKQLESFSDEKTLREGMEKQLKEMRANMEKQIKSQVENIEIQKTQLGDTLEILNREKNRLQLK